MRTPAHERFPVDRGDRKLLTIMGRHRCRCRCRRRRRRSIHLLFIVVAVCRKSPNDLAHFSLNVFFIALLSSSSPYIRTYHFSHMQIISFYKNLISIICLFIYLWIFFLFMRFERWSSIASLLSTLFSCLSPTHTHTKHYTTTVKRIDVFCWCFHFPFYSLIKFTWVVHSSRQNIIYIYARREHNQKSKYLRKNEKKFCNSFESARDFHHFLRQP